MMEILNNGNEEAEPLEVADEILGMLESRKTLIYCLHTLLDQFELHLDGITKKYKAMAITLLLATFAGIGFFFSVETKELQINKLLVASIVSLFGIIGIYSIWYLDIQVFHKFWGSFFVEEVRMEKTFKFLIDIGDVSISLDNVNARIFGNGHFYIAIIALLIITLGITLSFLYATYWYKIFIFALTILSILFSIKSMNKSCKKLQAALERLLSVKYFQ